MDKENLKRKKSEAEGDAELNAEEIVRTPDEAITNEMAVGAEASAGVGETETDAAGTKEAPVKRKPGRPKKESGAVAGGGRG